MPLVWELARVCGEHAGGYVHWGATTQNILETGDSLLLRNAHHRLLSQFKELFTALAELAERSAEMAMAGRTHGQHAVPITFGYKVAVWIDELARHVERLRALESRCFIACWAVQPARLHPWAAKASSCKLTLHVDSVSNQRMYHQGPTETVKPNMW